MFKTARFLQIVGLAALLMLPAYATSLAPTAEKELTPLVLVPAGTYVRGLDRPLEVDHFTITLSAYQIEADEVTNRQYDQCVGANACKKPKWNGESTWPVRGVTWYDAEAYCKWAGRRLPTTAEWEKAAFPTFSGQDGRGPRISRHTDLCNILNIAGYPKYRGTSEPLISCKRTPKQPWTVSRVDQPIIGNDKDVSTIAGTRDVWDLFGNVAEWVEDWDDGKSYFHPPTLVDPKPPASDALGLKMIRGGSFLSKEGIDASDFRIAPSTERFKDVGFRCAADVKPPTSRSQKPAVEMTKNFPIQKVYNGVP